MVASPPPRPRQSSRDARPPLDELLRALHEASEGEDLQAAVDRIAEGERAAMREALKRVCELLEPGRPPAAGPLDLPY